MCAWRLTRARVTMDFCKRQTATATPAKAGDLPIGLGRRPEPRPRIASPLRKARTNRNVQTESGAPDFDNELLRQNKRDESRVLLLVLRLKRSQPGFRAVPWWEVLLTAGNRLGYRSAIPIYGISYHQVEPDRVAPRSRLERTTVSGVLPILRSVSRLAAESVSNEA
jgi:hypothetical protein